jgi:hypothetical protein
VLVQEAAARIPKPLAGMYCQEAHLFLEVSRIFKKVDEAPDTTHDIVSAPIQKLIVQP